MGALHQLVQDPEKRRAVIDDGVIAIDAEVASKKGLTGMAVKAAFATVKKVRPGIIPMALDSLLDDFALQVDPFYEAWKASGQGTLEEWFVARATEIANALLSITDERARHAKHRAIKGAYNKLRPQAVQHTAAAMPRVAWLVQKHLG